MYYKIVKNGKTVQESSLTKEEAIKQLLTVAADSTNYYLFDGGTTITDPDSKKVIFELGDEVAKIGDNTFEIVQENED